MSKQQLQFVYYSEVCLFWYQTSDDMSSFSRSLDYKKDMFMLVLKLFLIQCHSQGIIFTAI